MLTKNRRRDFTGDEADGGAALGVDAPVVAVPSWARGGDGRTRRGLARWMVTVRLSWASSDSGEARTSAAAAPVRSGRRRYARNTAGKHRTRGSEDAHEGGIEEERVRGIGEGLTVTEK